MLAAVDALRMPAMLRTIPEWFEAWEQVLSRFRFNSELTLLNQVHEKPVPVSETLWDVFQMARAAEEMTEGLVTPTLLEAVIDAGYDRSFDLLPDQSYGLRLNPVLTVSPPLAAIYFDEVKRTITLPMHAGIDLGGVAKGWAAHQAMLRMQADGPTLIDAGGDIAISGPRANGSPWLIGVADPFKPGWEIETLGLKACGVATSGKSHRRWMRDGVMQHHIIDPDTNQPAQTDLLTVTVIAPDVIQAEAAAKAAFILGSRDGMAWIESQADLAAVFILDNGRLMHSRAM